MHRAFSRVEWRWALWMSLIGCLPSRWGEMQLSPPFYGSSKLTSLGLQMGTRIPVSRVQSPGFYRLHSPGMVFPGSQPSASCSAGDWKWGPPPFLFLMVKIVIQTEYNGHASPWGACQECTSPCSAPGLSDFIVLGCLPGNLSDNHLTSLSLGMKSKPTLLLGC